ncbi:MAG: PDZ domain-containing protein [Deltaproteobacteria bacterium]|uniref:PDZ domain-containing protein n=1 Tax=Candidatus Desulfacyla euxinica TaxID=2841693 RepID=A0A8J6N207_9DELT|nr:PDZ domain-containing protein [Candidatus Desulfacyla euxinica]
MKYRICLTVLCLLFLVSLVSCQNRFQRAQSQIKRDTIHATYPKHRIDNLIKKICIIGTGEGVGHISSRLTELIMKSPSNIEVIESGNLDVVLGGRILEYKTGLTRDEALALSQLIQVDHVLYFDAKTTPYANYKYGGRLSVQIALKIVDTRNGNIIYQLTKVWAMTYPPADRFFWSPVPDADLYHMLSNLVAFELCNALGMANLGVTFKRDATGAVVYGVFSGSPGERAGLREWDKLVELNGVTIHSYADVKNYRKIGKRIKQGETVKAKIERDGEILEVELRFPFIRFAPEKKRYKEEKKERTKKLPI